MKLSLWRKSAVGASLNQRLGSKPGEAGKISGVQRKNAMATAMEKISNDFNEILSAALSLSPGERAMLADHLLQSLDRPDQKRIDALWAEEVERRIREIDEGKVELIDGDLVMQRFELDEN